MHNVRLQWGVRIPTRDGTHLGATVYLPEPLPEPTICIVTLTPYGADTYHERGVYFASHGFPFAIVDARGRGDSEGQFRPFIQEASDGYDLVEWLALQPYCNGKVAMWGGSYAGFNQWATARECPPHLGTIVPAAAACAGVDFPMRNNIRFPYLMQWITYTSGRAAQARLFADNTLWSQLYQAWHASGRAFRDLDVLVGNPSAVFQEWLSHPQADAYWDAYNPSAEQYARLTLPILTITGSYDDDQPGALEHYREHLRNAPPEAGARHYLVIGPWDHAGTRTPLRKFGGLEFGPASLVDLPDLHLQWYRWTLLNGCKPAFLEKRVAYYVMGAEHWRYADSLEEVTAGHRSCFLDSNGQANEVFDSGSLGSEPGTGHPDQFVYDPCEGGGPHIDAEARSSGGSLIDQSILLALGGKALVYHSAPFADDTEVSGFFSLSVWLSIDCPDTDFYVSVHEIISAGVAIRLSTDAIRARYREGLRTPRLIDTLEPLRYDFQRFTFVSRLVRRGHRLRLVIAPLGRIVETTFVEKNYNGGGVVCEETAAQGRPVTVRLFHDAAHPSVLRIPLGRG